MTLHQGIGYEYLHIQTPYTFNKLRINSIHDEMRYNSSIMICHPHLFAALASLHIDTEQAKGVAKEIRRRETR